VRRPGKRLVEFFGKRARNVGGYGAAAPQLIESHLPCLTPTLQLGTKPVVPGLRQESGFALPMQSLYGRFFAGHSCQQHFGFIHHWIPVRKSKCSQQRARTQALPQQRKQHYPKNHRNQKTAVRQVRRKPQRKRDRQRPS
jgi:hypothetical protein